MAGYSYEWNFMQHFAEHEDFFFQTARNQLRSLWTAYCLHNFLEVHTSGYDMDIRGLWTSVENNDTNFWTDDEETKGWELFGSFMSEEMI